MSTKILGKFGEIYARNLLIKNGYRIIANNYSCKVGEIDIIALDKDCLVLVEVKTRMSSKFGLPEEAVTPRKIYKIRRTGEWFISQNIGLPKKIRIDVVSLMFEKGRMVREKIIRSV